MLCLLDVIILLIPLKSVACAFYGSDSQTHRILPADSYQVLGKPGFRQLGQCNITFAWLIPPPASSLDAYGHALACTRLQLHDGRVIRSASNLDSDSNLAGNRPEDELKKINKDLTATMADLSQLDALMRSDQGISIQSLSTSGSRLADGSRYFYLADRIGNLNILVLLRPGQQIKLELIDPISPDHVFTPQHVLCSRKQCPPTTNSLSTLDISSAESVSSNLSSSNRILSAALLKAEKQNRDLYTQLIISRVACALLSFLCIVFILTALTLCFRLRRPPVCYGSKHAPSEVSPCREHHASSSYFQPNGNLNLGQPSPVFLTDASPRQAGLSHLPSETGSVSNIVMNTSNISECGGLPISYAALGSQYGALTAYPVTAGRATTYNDGSSVVTFVPVNSRGILLPYHNGSTSPAPSHHSLNETKSGVTRSGSLGRYSASSVCYTDNGRRRLLRLSKPVGVAKYPDDPMLKARLVNPVGEHHNLEQVPDAKPGEITTRLHSFQVAGNLGSFQLHNSTKPQVIHRYPSEPQPTYAGLSGNRVSVNDDRASSKSNRSNHIQEPSLGVTRKSALVT